MSDETGSVAGRLPDTITDLDGALHSIAPADVTVGWRRIAAADLSSLFPLERLAVNRAVASRQREFASGRVLLRDLIGRHIPIPIADNRAPVFPAAVRGSLAHDANFAVAAVSLSDEVISLGIDIEPQVPLAPDMAQMILRSDEQGIEPHLAFTLKEAAYKAWSGLGGAMLDHHDVRLELAGRAFRAEIVSTDVSLDGVFADAGHQWVALVVVRGRVHP